MKIPRPNAPTIAAAGIATGGLIKSQLSDLASRIRSQLIVQARFEHEIGPAIRAYCFSHFQKSPSGDRLYEGRDVYVRPEGKVLLVGYEDIGREPALFWDGHVPLLVTGSGDRYGATLSFIRGTLDIDELVSDALKEHNARAHSGHPKCRFTIVRHFGLGGTGGTGRSGDDEAPQIERYSIGWPFWHSTRLLDWRLDEIGPAPLDGRGAIGSLALPKDMIACVDEVRHWLDSEEWYRSRHIPWRRGWLLKGLPGTGKSTE